MRVYVPATIALLQNFSQEQEFRPLGGTAFAVTPALREAFTSGDDEELAEVAIREAARAALRLLANEGEGPNPVRRAVIAADVPDADVTVRSDLDDAVVKVAGLITTAMVDSVLVDGAAAETDVAAAVAVVDEADLGEEDAELVVGDALEHDLGWYASSEVPFLLELL